MKHLKERLLISRNPNQQFDENLSFGERLADKIADFVGSKTVLERNVITKSISKRS